MATNPGPARVGTVTLGGRTFTVTQKANLWSEATDLGGGWKRLGWFGIFNTSFAPWIYHTDHGWMYPVGIDTSSIWFWDNAMGAWWWTAATVYPFVYRSSDSTWMFYVVNSAGPRWFYNYRTSQWEQQ